MAYPARAVDEPIAMKVNTIPFTNWKYVRQGSFVWVGSGPPGRGVAGLAPGRATGRPRSGHGP